MRILIIHLGSLLNKSAGETVRTENMAKSLNNLGFNVTILYLYSIFKLRINNLKFRDNRNEVDRLYLPTFPVSRFCKLGQLYNNILVWIVAKILRADLIQAEIAWSASITKFLSIPLITDFHSDIVPELEATGANDNFIEKSRLDNIFALRNSHSITCVSKILYDNLVSTYGIKPNYHILPCCVNLEHFSEDRLSVRDSVRKKYNLQNKLVLCYLGGTHQWQCLKETFEIFIRLQKLDDRYYFCLFTRDNLDDYKDYIEACKDSFMTKALDNTNLVEYLSMIDAGFVLRDNLMLNINSSPTKTAEYMAAGAMVIATCYSGDAPALIEDSGLGCILESKEPSDFELLNLHEKLSSYTVDYCKNSLKSKQFIKENRWWNKNEDVLRILYSDFINQKYV